MISMKLISLILFFLLPFFLLAQLNGKVIRVKDGDTFVLLDSNKVQYTIRVAAIDCPEKKQAFGTVATDYVSSQIFGKYVEIKNTSKDRYGRTIGMVFYDNKNLSEELLKVGLAWHYKRYSKSTKLQKLEDTARLNKIGLWIDKNPIPPYEWRKLN